jgi:hypothetical protein
VTSSFVVVESTSVVVELIFASQDSPSHPSLTLELVGLLVGHSSTVLNGSEHSNCYSMRSWGGFATLDCRCWSMGCSWEDNWFVPHSSLALDLQMNTNGKFH